MHVLRMHALRRPFGIPCDMTFQTTTTTANTTAGQDCYCSAHMAFKSGTPMAEYTSTNDLYNQNQQHGYDLPIIEKVRGWGGGWRDGTAGGMVQGTEPLPQ